MNTLKPEASSFSVFLAVQLPPSASYSDGESERKRRERERERERERGMEMEEERIAMVLIRATELRSKIANCISKTNAIEGSSANIGNGVHENLPSMETGQVVNEEEADTLLNICDAFDSLESQLTSLQALLQQQQYERETVMREIEYSRKVLLKKLEEYKGEHLDVIHEAEAFASMKVEHDNELLLPPYPTCARHSLVLDRSQLSGFSYTQKRAENHCNGSDLRNEPNNSETQNRSGKLWGGLRFLVQSTAKTMLTLVGVFSLLNLAGFEPRLSKKGAHLKVFTSFQRPGAEDRRLTAKCPPGRVAVMKDGEIHCVVKERVEIPLDSLGENPTVNYGCG